MRLHEDVDAFATVIGKVSEASGIRMDVLEKDYYVVLFLDELRRLQADGLRAYFKGGTALYKALKEPIRFSEDIDLSVDVRGLPSRTQRDKALKRASKRFSSLPLSLGKGYTYRQAIEAVYEYKPCVSVDAFDELDRFGCVKVEATSFTIAEPTTSIEVSWMLCDYATNQQREILVDQYGMASFAVGSLTLERIFVDKLFAAESYTLRSADPDRAADAAKHIFDLSIMVGIPEVQTLLNDPDALATLLDIRMREEIGRRDGIPHRAPRDFVFFDAAFADRNVSRAYPRMLSRYVFDPSRAITFDESRLAIRSIRDALAVNRAWIDAAPPTDGAASASGRAVMPR